MINWRVLLVISWLAVEGARAGEPSPVGGWLERPLLGTNTTLTETLAFAEARIPTMARVESAQAWEQIAARLRREVLERVVFRGEAVQWRLQRGRVVWLDTIPGGPEYRIRKLRYEAVPGLWIPALLYEPTARAGKMPAVLNLNGHEGIGKAVDYKQTRCINEAKRGMLALNPEWLGMGQLRGDQYQHGRMNQLDLCGASGVAVFYLAMARGLDVLLAHPQADPERVAVAGLSGGGWQTIFLSALDPRVTLANPVAGYSSLLTRTRFWEDLGDSEQIPCDLATVADYTHLTALRAPRPMLLTYNAKDNCCFAAAHALGPLWEAALPIYQLYGQERRLRSHINETPGDHNFGLDNRQALYRMLGDFFQSGNPNYNPLEIACEAELKSPRELEVELPADNANFNSLALALSKTLPRNPKLPAAAGAAKRWQQEGRKQLAGIARARYMTVSAEKIGSETNGMSRAVFWRLKVDGAWTVPAVELARGEPRETTLLIADTGRKSAAAAAERLLGQGRRVLAVDPFYFGESALGSPAVPFALLVSAVGERPLGLQAGQLAAIARWSQTEYGAGPVRLAANGPRCGVIALVTAGLEERAIGELELEGAMGSLKQILESNGTVDQTPELFCFGLLEAFDLRQLVALTAPRPVKFRAPGDRLRSELEDIGDWYRLLGATFHW